MMLNGWVEKNIKAEFTEHQERGRKKVKKCYSKQRLAEINCNLPSLFYAFIMLQIASLL